MSQDDLQDKLWCCVGRGEDLEKLRMMEGGQEKMGRRRNVLFFGWKW
jgi:hypothetical protein